MSSLLDPDIRPSTLYFHIPFCRNLCHYCDFKKTARWDDQLVDSYFSTLLSHLRDWLDFYQGHLGPLKAISFGGGTPSLFTQEYHPLFKSLRQFINADTEISLEANPLDISRQNLKSWQELGFNRISIGVQSLEEAGLKFLHRDHSSDQALKSIDMSQQYIANVGVDLIYGWQGQTAKQWENELIHLGNHSHLNHLSLYNLTYEPQTPIGRAYSRGKLVKMHDDLEADLYELACLRLKSSHWQHYEVSNWSKPRYASIHNRLYWDNTYYLGLGLGAHGYLASRKNSLGFRYHYPARLPSFIKHSSCSKGNAPSSIACAHKLNFSEQREAITWLYEYVGSSLRTQEGCNLALIANKTSLAFQPTPTLQQLLDSGHAHLHKSFFRLDEHEWFRENTWARFIIDSFRA